MDCTRSDQGCRFRKHAFYSVVDYAYFALRPPDTAVKMPSPMKALAVT